MPKIPDSGLEFFCHAGRFIPVVVLTQWIMQKDSNGNDQWVNGSFFFGFLPKDGAIPASFPAVVSMQMQK